MNRAVGEHLKGVFVVVFYDDRVVEMLGHALDGKGSLDVVYDVMEI